MKKLYKIAVLLLALICAVSAAVPYACADDNSSAEEATQKRYEGMCAFAEEHFEDLTLPEYEDMIVTEKDKLMFVQSEHGFVRAQKMFTAPDGEEVCAGVNELSQVKVFAQKGDYSFVIIMEDVDGTMGWVETEYLTDSWNYNISMGRTINSY
jgi:hypothetical protein